MQGIIVKSISKALFLFSYNNLNSHSQTRFLLSCIVFLLITLSVGCSEDSTLTTDTESFITTWDTSRKGTTANNQIMITTPIGDYDYNVDWGDGHIDYNAAGTIIHTYATAGTYTVKISGKFPRIVLDRYSDAEKLLTIEQWGNIKWRSMSRAFRGGKNLVINATDAPDLSLVTNMSQMFEDASNLNQDLSSWNVSSVTNMSKMFSDAKAFNQDLSSWNVSSVTDMSGMFYGAMAFNQDLSSWDVSSVTDMSHMFSSAQVFNQDLSSWGVSSVTNLSGMFSGAWAFNQDLSSWDVSSVTDMSGMFSWTQVFNQDLSSWDVSSVTNMYSMFDSAESFNQNLSAWNVSSVTKMDYMFNSISISTTNYDALLLGWSTQSLQTGVRFDAGFSQYSSSSQTARDILTDVFGWHISDSGVNP